jgi:predicted phosphodiesterase
VGPESPIAHGRTVPVRVPSSGENPDPGYGDTMPIRLRTRAVAKAALAVAVWLAMTVGCASLIFTHSSREVVLASHDAVVRPTYEPWIEVRTGPILPNLRAESQAPIGAQIQLGKTDAGSIDELMQRYAVIGAHPQAQIEKVRGALSQMAVSAVLRGGVVAGLPLLVWVLVGRTRRRDLVGRLRSPAVTAGTLAVVAVAVVLIEPWDVTDPTSESERRWVSLEEFAGVEVALPGDLPPVQISGDITTRQTRRLIQSALDTYDRSKHFYAEVVARVGEIEVRVPEPGDTVVALVSDRHDNVGMDPVARAIADRGGASAVFNAGDDTSSGKSWEAFSLDSVTEEFEDFDRWAVTGNHDNGDFVGPYLLDLGWTRLSGEVVDGPGGTTLLGVDDPRRSGLGNWRDEGPRTFTEIGRELADTACAADERVTTLLVHDTNLGREALRRGCVDLVVGGHLHVRTGPDATVGVNGETGYTYINGTTGGAAYTIAVGSKPRRMAEVSLITYRDGRPLGVQAVVIQTNGRVSVTDFVPMGAP